MKWLKVPGWPYEVSTSGEVRRVGAKKPLAVRVNGKGYPQVVMHDNPRQRDIRVHQLVAWVFLGPPPNGEPHVNHINGNKLDNRPENLEWISPDANMEHGVRLGLFARGPRLTSTKLNPEAVREIRLRARNGESPPALARAFGVSLTTTRSVIAHRLWRWVA